MEATSHKQSERRIREDLFQARKITPAEVIPQLKNKLKQNLDFFSLKFKSYKTWRACLATFALV